VCRVGVQLCAYRGPPPSPLKDLSGDCSMDTPVLSYGDVLLRHEDVSLLQPGRWLNDQVMRVCVVLPPDPRPDSV